MDHIKIIETRCPHCGKEFDSTLNADDSDGCPSPGDASVCCKCAGISVFTEDLQLAHPDREAIERWKADSELWEVIDAAVAQVKAAANYAEIRRAVEQQRRRP